MNYAAYIQQDPVTMGFIITVPHVVDRFVSDMARLPAGISQRDIRNRKLWRIDVAHIFTIHDLAAQYYKVVNLVKPDYKPGPFEFSDIFDNGTAYDVLHLKPTAPPEVVMAVFRALSKMYHPDTGENPDPTMFDRVAVAKASIMKDG